MEEIRNNLEATIAEVHKVITSTSLFTKRCTSCSAMPAKGKTFWNSAHF